MTTLKRLLLGLALAIFAGSPASVLVDGPDKSGVYGGAQEARDGTLRSQTFAQFRQQNAALLAWQNQANLTYFKLYPSKGIILCHSFS